MVGAIIVSLPLTLWRNESKAIAHVLPSSIYFVARVIERWCKTTKQTMTSESVIQQIKTYMAQNEWSKAISVCEEQIAKEPNRIELYPFLAKAYTSQGRLTEAIATYQQALGTALNQAEIYAEIGLLYSKQQQFVRAAWHYQKALSINPNWAELQYNLGVVLHQLGDWEKSIAAYQEALKLKPNYYTVYFNLGVLYDRRGELKLAVEHYQRAIEIQPDYIKAYSNLGSTLAKQRSYDSAIRVLQQALYLNPTWSTLHNNIGQIYLLNGESDKALDSFEMAISLDSTMGLAYNNLAKLWQQEGNLREVVGSLKRFISLEPTNVAAFSFLAGVLLYRGNRKEGLKYLRSAVALEPTFVNAYCQGEYSRDSTDLLQRAKASCADFLKALQKDLPDEEVLEYLWQTYSNWGDVLLEYGGLLEAESYYRQGIDIKPDRVSLYLNLGNCLAKQERWNAAIAIYQMGLALEPNHGQICFQLGKILEKNDLPHSAVNYYEKILKDKSYKEGMWQNLPQLFPTEAALSHFPKAMYPRTHDWIRDCDLEDYSYTEVAWEGTEAKNTQRQTLSAVTLDRGKNKSASRTDCGGVSCNNCMSELVEGFRPVALGNRSYQCSFENAPQIKAPLPFVATIPEGRVWNAPQKNSWLICNATAVITPDNYLLGDVSRSYPWYLPPCSYKEQAERTLFNLEELPDLTELSGKVALLTGLAGHVYYHWMFDILPRLEILRLSGINLETIDRFVVNYNEKPFQKETLSWLGIPLEKIVSSDRNSYIKASELIVPSFPGYLDWVPFGTIKFLRQTFLPKLSLDSSQFGKKIYVSRARARGRKIINEESVAKFLNERGFTTVYLEEMTVLEQVALFANAKAIVTPHGSGLTNLAFCSPKTKVVELFSPHYLRTDYWMISQELDLHHYYCLGESFNCHILRNLMYQNSLTEDILVNLNSLELVLKAANIDN